MVYILWFYGFMVLYGLHNMVLYRFIWFYIVLYRFIWFYMVLYGFIWFYMVLYGLYNMVLYDVFFWLNLEKNGIRMG